MSIWNAKELKLMDKMLENGLELEVLHSFLPNRTLDAVYRKCTNLGYGKFTDKDGITKLHLGVRARRVTRKTTRPLGAAPTAKESTILEITSKDNAIVAQNNVYDSLLDANAVAVKILTDNTLPAEPDIVHVLSKFILSNKR